MLMNVTALILFTINAVIQWNKWDEALPVGNGRLGGMVFGGVDEERIQLNENTYWSGGPYSTVVAGASKWLPEEVARVVDVRTSPISERIAAIVQANYDGADLLGAVAQVAGGLLQECPGARRALVVQPELLDMAAVAVPADGIVRFSGPFRDYDGIVIIDHGRGWMSLIVNVASPLKPGARVRLGAPLATAVEASRTGAHFVRQRRGPARSRRRERIEAASCGHRACAAARCASRRDASTSARAVPAGGPGGGAGQLTAVGQGSGPGVPDGTNCSHNSSRRADISCSTRATPRSSPRSATRAGTCCARGACARSGSSAPCADPTCGHDGRDPRDHGKRFWDALVEACRGIGPTGVAPPCSRQRPPVPCPSFAHFPPLRVFRYVSFRIIAAMLTAMIISFVLVAAVHIGGRKGQGDERR